MRKWLLSLLVLGLLAFTYLFTPGFSGTAHAQSLSSPRSTVCSTTHVHLNKNLPATIRCLDKTASSGLLPSAGENDSCPGTALWLYRDINHGGPRLCIDGQGLFNMSWACYNYQPQTGQCLQDWNDLTSSYWDGCSSVDFYDSFNRTGNAFTGAPWETNNFPRYSVGNDTLSSVYLEIAC